VTGNWVESGKIMEGALNPSQILQPPPVPSTQYPVPGAAFLPHMPVGDRWGTPRRYLLSLNVLLHPTTVKNQLINSVVNF
jgi:hypothetical protein